MAYFEGIDYHCIKCRFPNCASESLVLSNGDTTYTILLNTWFSDDVLYDRLEHELRHLADDHFYRGQSIAEIEREADGKTTAIPRPGEWPEYKPSGETDYIASWRCAMSWAQKLIDAGATL